MHFFGPTLAAFASLFVLADAKSHVKVHLSVPTLIQCEEAVFRWQGGNPPFKVWAQEDSRSPDAISSIVESTNGYTASWVVDAPAGTRVQVRLKDGKGHWVKTYAEVYEGKSDECVNLKYPDPSEPARKPPAPKWRVTQGLEFIALAVGLVLACAGIAWSIKKTDKKPQARGEYIAVNELPSEDPDFQSARSGARATRRTTPTRSIFPTDAEEVLGHEGEEFRSLLPGKKRTD